MTATGNYHPSFQPIADQIKERGFHSPYAYVEYWPETWSHGHMVPAGDGEISSVDYLAQTENLDVEGALEAIGEELAKAVAMCNLRRHKAHGRAHPEQDQEKAYRVAISQLVTKEFDIEWTYLDWRIRMYKKWGGHMPAAVVMPTNTEASRWQMMIPDSEGDPTFRGVRSDFAPNVLPPAEVRAVEHPLMGFTMPRRWTAERRLKFIMEQQAKERSN